MNIRTIGRPLPAPVKRAIDLEVERARYRRRRRRHRRHGPAVPRPGLTVLVHPQMPIFEHTLSKVLAMVDATMTTDPTRPHDVAVHFDDTTYPAPGPQTRALLEAGPVINGRCLDISKTRVNEAFAETFGYPLGIDPLTHEGVAVEKSEVNARHDGRLVQCPTTPLPGRCYQRLVDTTTDDGRHVAVLRVPVIGDRIPVVYDKVRPVADRLTDAEPSAHMCATEDLLSECEVTDLIRFAKAMEMDVGELDVLRDRHDGRIYVVDANPTPWGPPLDLVERGREDEAIAALVPAHLELFDAFRVAGSEAHARG